MKYLRPLHRFILSAATFCVLAVPPVYAQSASHFETPLMVVRFNQDRVYYQQPLFGAVSRALEAKPSVMFNIISLVPETGNTRTDKRLEEEAQRSTGRFVNDMLQMGVPQNRIRISYQANRAVTANEVHLFVE